MEDKVHFSSIKEGREKYFVEYRPPLHGFQFATLQLTYPIENPLEIVAHDMEVEGLIWLSRYPLSLMVSAFGPLGELVHLGRVRPENHYMLYLADGQVKGYWRLLANEKMSRDALSQGRLLAVYSDVTYRTSGEVKASAKEYAYKMRSAWSLVFLWAVVAPGAFLVLEYFGPEWLATLVFVYSIYKATEKAFKMTGRCKKSSAELAKEEEELLLRHHHYHCMRNPEGFIRLKLESFEKDQRAEIQKESAALNMKTRDAG